MKRSILLLLGLAVSLGACAREAGAPSDTQGARPRAVPPHRPCPTGGGACQRPSHCSTRHSCECAGVPLARRSAPGAGVDGSDDAPVGTTSLEKIADLPAQHQLPDGKWKPGVNYDPVVPRSPPRCRRARSKYSRCSGTPVRTATPWSLHRGLAQTKPDYVAVRARAGHVGARASCPCAAVLHTQAAGSQ